MREVFKCFLTGVGLITILTSLYFIVVGFGWCMSHSVIFAMSVLAVIVLLVTTGFGAFIRYACMNGGNLYMPDEFVEIEAPSQDIPTILTPIQETVVS